MIEQFPDLFKDNTAIKDTETNINFKPGHYPVKQKRDRCHFTFKKKSVKNWKTNKNGTLEESESRRRRLFRILGGNYGKNDKSIKNALDSRKLNDSCLKTRPHMPNMEELLNQISVKITMKLMISKIDLDYAYG